MYAAAPSASGPGPGRVFGMRGLLSLRATDAPAGDAAAPARGHPTRRALIATLLVCGGYYAGGAIGMEMRLVPGGPTEIWLPQGILLAALLTAPARRWWLYAVALLPTHAQLTAALSPQVPASMMFVQFAGQFVQAAVAAALLRPILGNPPRLDSLRRMGAFIFGGTFLVPLRRPGRGRRHLRRQRLRARLLGAVAAARAGADGRCGHRRGADPFTSRPAGWRGSGAGRGGLPSSCC